MSFSLDDLAALIKMRRYDTASKSYTKSLFDSGAPRIAKKFGEEAVEAVMSISLGLTEQRQRLTRATPRQEPSALSLQAISPLYQSVHPRCHCPLAQQ